MSTIGSVGPSHTARGVPNPKIGNPLAGLADAVDRRRQVLLENEDAVNTLRNAEDERQLKIDRAHALASFAKTKTEIAISQSELAQAYDPSGREFTKNADDIAAKKLEEFNASIRPELRPEFEPDIASFRGQRKLDAYGVQTSMEGANYKAGLADLQKQATDEIFTGKASVEDWVPKIQAYVANSPLTKLETQQLAEQLNHDLEAIDIAVQAKDEVANWANYSRADEGDTPAGMPAVAAGLLGIIGQLESGNRANVLNGGELFTGFEDHPGRKGAGGTTTAAGTYQFIKATWERAKAALGLKDFSPANQKRAAWWLAQNDYQARTGRNLEADLASGDPDIIEQVRKVLGGQGEENVTWAALQNVSKEKFYAAVTGGKDVPPSVMDDPAYSHLSAIEKSNAVILARKAAQEELQLQLRRQEAQRNLDIEDMKKQIAQGLATQQQVTEFAADKFLSQSQTSELQKMWADGHEDDVALQRFAASAQNPGSTFSPDDAKGFDVLYARQGKEAVANQDQKYMSSVMLPLSARSGMLPAGLVEDLKNGAQSSNPARSQFAYTNMALLQQQNGALFRKEFGDDAESDLTFFQIYSQYASPEEAIQRIKDSRDPTKKMAVEITNKAVESYMKDYPGSFAAPGIAGEMGLDPDISVTDPSQSLAMQAEFQLLFKQEMARYGNGSDAYGAAIARMKTRWGEVSYGAGENYLMKNTPAIAGVPTVGGTYDWVEKYVRKDMGLGGLNKFRLVSDHITEWNINKKEPVSYMAEEEVAPGYWLPVMDEETGMPARTALLPADAKAADAESAFWYRNMTTLDDMRWAARSHPGAAGEAAAKMLEGAVVKLTEQKPELGASYTGMADRAIRTPPTEDEMAKLIAQFGFASVDEMQAFVARGDYNGLIERYKGN